MTTEGLFWFTFFLGFIPGLVLGVLSMRIQWQRADIERLTAELRTLREHGGGHE